MVRYCLIIVLLLGYLPGAVAQSLIWDPGQIAALAAQRANIAIALSSLATLQQHFNQMSGALGGAGARPSRLMVPILLPDPAIDVTSAAAVWSPAVGLSGQNSSSAIQQNIQRGRQALQRAAIDGLTLAATTDQALSTLSEAGAILQNDVAQSADLRGDVQANSAIALTILSQAMSIKALIAMDVQQYAAMMSIH
jgi:hypothetical protein